MQGDPAKTGPPPGYADPPPSYQASVHGFQPMPPGYPPAAGGPPPPGFTASGAPPGGPPSAPPYYASWLPQGTAVPAATAVVVNVSEWGPYPVQVTCPNCGSQVLTATSTRPGLLTWLLSGACFLFGCWPCCLIPCCIPECQDVEHHCPSCKNHLCTFRRL